MYSTVMTITPEVASEMLKKNVKNRRVSQSRVQKMAHEIKTGHWVLNGEAIIFSVDGTLIDGQHRLSAVVIAGTPIRTQVTFGVEDERAFEMMNIGKSRTVDQILDMDGYKNSKEVNAIARRIMSWELCQDKTKFKFKNIDSTSDLLEFTKSNYDEFFEMFQTVRYSLPYKRCGAGAAFTAALVILKRCDYPNTMRFVEQIKTGANLQPGAPALTLRDRLIFSEPVRGSLAELELMALVIKSFNYFARGKSLKSLRWVSTGDNAECFPVPTGWRE